MTTKSILNELRILGRTLVRELGVVDSATSRHDISLTQSHILVELDRQKKLTASDLSEQLFVDKALISRVLSQLIERKLIAVQEDEHDRRRKHLTLTALGKRKVEGIHNEADARVAEALHLLSPAERLRVVEGLSLYVKALHEARIVANERS